MTRSAVGEKIRPGWSPPSAQARARKDSMQNMQRMAPAGARRNHRIDAVAVEERADAIAVTSQEPRQQGDEFSRDGAFFHAGAEVHGRAQVEQKPGHHFAVFVVDSHIRRLETSGDVPIDVANVVVILILAQIGEIEPETAKQGAGSCRAAGRRGVGAPSTPDGAGCPRRRGMRESCTDRLIAPSLRGFKPFSRSKRSSRCPLTRARGTCW